MAIILPDPDIIWKIHDQLHNFINLISIFKA